MKLLVTGAGSRLGGYLARTWQERESVALRLTDCLPAEAASVPGAEWIQADLRDPEVIPDLVQDVDHILHLESLDWPNRISLPPAERLYRSTCGLYNLILGAQAAGVSRFVLASSLSLFDRLPHNWHVNEIWRPRPAPHLQDLCPWLAELSVRETIRQGAMLAICLRFGLLVDESDVEGTAFDARWVHLQDAVHAVERALSFDAGAMRNATRPDWYVFHISAPGPHAKIRLRHATGHEERAISTMPPFSYAPRHEFQPGDAGASALGPQDAVPWQEAIQAGPASVARPIRRVVIFGAGGPMGAATAHEMKHTCQLRLCDIRDIEETAELLPADPAERPTPPRLDRPHEYRVVDMRDTGQVVDACAGMDAIINCSVLRHRLHDAFHVNVVGACNIVQGAVAHGIRRVVQTGPFQQMDPGYGSYVWDYDIPVEAPARPLAYLYHHTKFLGQEIMRVFAEFHDLEVAVMLFWRLVAPGAGWHQIPPFAVSWADSGRVLHRAVEVPALPSAYEEFNVSADMPHRKFSHRKLRDVLGFTVRDGLEEYWRD